MTFWDWRRGSGATMTNGSAALAVPTDLAPIELYTADTRIVGWIAPNGRRVTDLLNEQTELRLWRPHPGPIDATDQPAGGPESTGDWYSLSSASVVLAMPPEWRASRQLRLHRRLRRVAVHAGPFSVTGNVHIPPGAEAGPHLLRGAGRFLPLTDAHILHAGEPPFEHVVSVVIINADHVTQIVPLISLA